jgi:predicted enzyme related to lactoylglutathione lyase
MSMAKVLGIGGVFIKSRDPEALRTWYAEHLGIDLEEWGGAMFWSPGEQKTYSVWCPFKSDTSYFDPSTREVMVNFRVDDVDALTKRLRDSGVVVLDRRQESEDGIFAYAVDPDGTLLELWQPRS